MFDKRGTGRDYQAVGGIVLLLMGSLFLAGQLLEETTTSLLVVPAAGALLLLWGILIRHAGPLIPGGIVTGVGMGLLFGAKGDEEALFMLWLGLGFLLVVIFTALFTSTTHRWALIPGSIIALVGLGSRFGDAVWNSLSMWPLILIGGGLYILFKNRSSLLQKNEERP